MDFLVDVRPTMFVSKLFDPVLSVTQFFRFSSVLILYSSITGHLVPTSVAIRFNIWYFWLLAASTLEEAPRLSIDTQCQSATSRCFLFLFFSRSVFLHSAGESSFGHVLTAEVLRTYAHISFSYDVHDITMTDVNTVYRQILQALTSRSQYQISIHIPHPKIGNDSLPRPLSQHALGRTCPLPQQRLHQ